MRSDPEGIFEAGCTAYALGDLDAAAAYFAEDAQFAIYVDRDVLPFGGQVIGRAAIQDVWRNMHQAFAVLRHAARNFTVQDDIVRCQIDFAFRHRKSGEVIDGVMRVVAQVEDGRIVRYREYHDQERIRAFMRLCDQSSSQEGSREESGKGAIAILVAAWPMGSAFDLANLVS
jgi:ketosteroid isomerase-like protein